MNVCWGYVSKVFVDQQMCDWRLDLARQMCIKVFVNQQILKLDLASFPDSPPPYLCCFRDLHLCYLFVYLCLYVHIYVSKCAIEQIRSDSPPPYLHSFRDLHLCSFHRCCLYPSIMEWCQKMLLEMQVLMVVMTILPH